MLKYIEFSNFRCFSHEKFLLSPSITIFQGANGIGKTSICEGINLIANGNSQITRSLNEVIGESSNIAKLKSHGNGFEALLSFENVNEKIKKSYFLNNKRHLAKDYKNSLNQTATLIDQKDLIYWIVNNSVKKRFLDLQIQKVFPGYLDLVSEFRVFKSLRSKILAEEIIDKTTLQNVNKSILILESKIIFRRYEYIKKIKPILWSFAQKLPLNLKDVDLVYKPFFENEEISHNEDSILEHLFEMYGQNGEKNASWDDINKDNFFVLVENKKIEKFFSSGQQKTTLLAIMLGLAHSSKNYSKEDDLILLDDVFAEIDVINQGKLMEIISGMDNQFVITLQNEKEIKNFAGHKIFNLNEDKNEK